MHAGRVLFTAGDETLEVTGVLGGRRIEGRENDSASDPLQFDLSSLGEPDAGARDKIMRRARSKDLARRGRGCEARA
jgi:hypothetical protein